METTANPSVLHEATGSEVVASSPAASSSLLENPSSSVNDASAETIHELEVEMARLRHELYAKRREATVATRLQKEAQTLAEQTTKDTNDIVEDYKRQLAQLQKQTDEAVQAKTNATKERDQARDEAERAKTEAATFTAAARDSEKQANAAAEDARLRLRLAEQRAADAEAEQLRAEEELAELRESSATGVADAVPPSPSADVTRSGSFGGDADATPRRAIAAAATARDERDAALIRVGALERELAVLRRESSEAENRAANAEAGQSRLENELAELRRKVTGTDATMSQQGSRGGDGDGDVAALRSRAEAAENRLANAEAELGELKRSGQGDAVRKLLLEVEDMSAELESLWSDNCALGEALGEAQAAARAAMQQAQAASLPPPATPPQSTATPREGTAEETLDEVALHDAPPPAPSPMKETAAFALDKNGGDPTNGGEDAYTTVLSGIHQKLELVRNV
ncbi:hypothetical protein RI054_07g37510 [Pseudoscourfieldia marina]